MKKIVILGGGFAGLTTAVRLEKKFAQDKNVSLTLIDKNNFHLFNSNLYEVATSAEELVSLDLLKKTITLPYKETLAGKNITFLQGNVVSINSKERVVSLESKKVEYDYLVIALGSMEEYFNIPGAKEFGIPLKSLMNALKIKNSIEFAIEAHRQDMQKKYVRVVVAGGGYAGVEVVGELKGLFDFLSWKYNYPRHKIEIEVVEASNCLMPGMGDRASNDALRRLNELGVHLRLLSPIVKVEASSIELKTGEKIVYDVLVWTAGVRARAFPEGLSLSLDAKGRAGVDEFLRLKEHDNIFILGDQAGVNKPSGQPVPPSAQDALHEAKYLSYALPMLMRNQRPASYVPKDHGFIVTLGPKWAILNYPPFYIKGRLAYIIHELADVRYFASIIGWWRAIKLTWTQDRLYGRND